MASLFDIHEQILNLVDLETGEISDFEAFEKLQLDLDTKIKNIALYVLNLESDARQLEEQEKKFYERKKAAENKAQRLRAYLDCFLQGQSRKYPGVALSYRPSEQVSIDDVSRIPKCFLTAVDPKIDKIGIREAIKQGETVPGASLVSKINLQIK